jgi:ATP-binding cassette subfamily B protein
MTRATPSALPLSFTDLPEEGLADIQTQLHPGENVQAVLEVDLDSSLRFGRGLLVATGSRLLAREPGQHTWQSWDYRAGLRLNRHDHAGVGHLELMDDRGRLAHWCYTLGQNLQAARLAEQVQRFLDSLRTGEPPPPPAAKAGLIDAEPAPAPVSTWNLLRLWRFARPYKGQLLLGFVLMLLGTAASLVPPYLTMPLMDNVLVPYQNGQAIDPSLVAWYLGGLFAAALVAWGLTWAKTYILALVSERIGADLRTTTYDHLLRLSLEYFGGKRTGDLMTRIGSETDRICVFLSLHLLDFFTDLVMLLMTAAILFSINPWLAVATLVPLPVIMWLIHAVRRKLKTGN